MTTTTTTDGTSVLVQVKKTNGKSSAVQLDTASTLTAVRAQLTTKKLMSINDSFLVDSTTGVDRDDEGSVKLSEVLKDKVLLIGLATDTSPIGTDDGVARYNLLNDDQKLAIFENVQLFRGLTFASDTFGKTFKDVYGWESGYSPTANNPRVITELVSNYAFNKVTKEIKTFSSDSTSMNVSSPYGSAEAEYKTEKSKTTSSSKVTEYLMTKYIVRKVDLKVDPQRLTVSPAFVAAVKKALKGNERTADGYANLIAVLNDFGYYVPVEFTLGGAILGTDSTQISDFSEAESEKKEFNSKFKAEFEGIGGGAAYSQASGTDKSNTTSSKYQNITMQLIGGDPGLEKDYPKWAESLKPAIKWSMADVSKFWPSLLLLAQDVEGRQLLGTAITLIEKFGSTGNTARLQQFIDMRAYNTTMQIAVNPFA
jgi:hypothetical protein